jgi:hypothetical protein
MPGDVLSGQKSVGLTLLSGQSDEQDLSALLRHGAVGRALRLAGTGLTAALQHEVSDEVQRVATTLLGVPTVELIVAGWRKHEDLLDAARATAQTSGLTRFVSLAAHRITHVDQMTVDVVVGEMRLPPLELALAVTADVDAALLIVSSGRLMGVRGGRCILHAKLQLDDETIADQRVQLDLHAERRFQPGYPLLASAEGSPSATASGG